MEQLIKYQLKGIDKDFVNLQKKVNGFIGEVSQIQLPFPTTLRYDKLQGATIPFNNSSFRTALFGGVNVEIEKFIYVKSFTYDAINRRYVILLNNNVTNFMTVNNLNEILVRFIIL